MTAWHGKRAVTEQRSVGQKRIPVIGSDAITTLKAGLRDLQTRASPSREACNVDLIRVRRLSSVPIERIIGTADQPAMLIIAEDKR